jgi:hypothetical protein
MARGGNMREDGFYWVLTDENVWLPAEYQSCEWFLFGIERAFKTNNFLEIGSRIFAPSSNK